MDIRTLLLARTHTVVLDPDRVAGASTRPTRDADLDKFEDALAQLGFVMSLDLAMTLRRLPHQTIQDLRAWMMETLTEAVGAQRPVVPLYRGFPQKPTADAADAASLVLRRLVTWLVARPEQPCPWCAQEKPLAALDPCGHLVCRSCWQGGTYVGCPICHRRVTVGDPFVTWDAAQAAPIEHSDGRLRLLYLGFDLIGAARARFEGLVTRTTALSVEDRAELEIVIDTIGPRAAAWLPKRIPIDETMAITLARLWMVAPDRGAMVRTTAGHLHTATDVLRVAVVLMGGNPELAEPIRLRSISRGLRRAILDALDHLAIEPIVEEVRRRAGLWKRVGERIHPFEHADQVTTSTLAFAVVRETKLSTATFGAALQAAATPVATLRIADDELRVEPWARVVEDGLRNGEPELAIARLVQRPGALLRRVDHLIRVARTRRPAAIIEVIAAIGNAIRRGAPGTLLVLGGHIARRGALWPRRVVFPLSRGSHTAPKGQLLRAWSMPDTREPLEAEVINVITTAIRNELVARAETRRMFPRAVIDRGLVDLLAPIGALRQAGGHRGTRAHLGLDHAAFLATQARPTLWDVACIHAAARANVIYVRERDGTIGTYRRRDAETAVQRLARITAADHDGRLTAIPVADAPTWFAVLRDDLVIPKGSAGYIAVARGTTALLDRTTAANLVAELRAR